MAASTQVNQSLCTLLGYSEHELLATTLRALTHTQDVDAALAYSRQLLAGETKRVSNGEALSA